MFAAEGQSVLAARTRRVDRMMQALSRMDEQVERLSTTVDRLDQPLTTELRRAVAELEWDGRRRHTFGQKLREASARLAEQRATRERIVRLLRQLARGDAPILVGPWTGEVGFELLYWAPFVRRALERFGIDPARLTVLSRGGTASWYGVDGVRYLDVLDLCTPDEFRLRTRKERKQRTVRVFDRLLIRRARQRLAVRASLLHPAMMYALFEPYWVLHAPAAWVHDCADFRRVVPPVIPGLQLPSTYVAARFYFSKCFPDTPENQARVRSLIERLAADTHVVLLGSGVQLDEHREIKPAAAASGDRIHMVEHLLRPETNLAVQTAVIAGAQAFIGTYGGFSYLAPMCGVNAVALYSRRNYYRHHLDFAQHVFQAIGGGSLTVVDAGTLN